MNPKSWTIIGGLLALALGMGLGACGKMHPAPEIGIVNYPADVAISDTTIDSNQSVTFVNRNGVDAVITQRQETVRGGDTTIFAPVAMSFFIGAGVKADTTGGNLGATLTLTYPKAAKKDQTNLIGKNSKIIFYGQDAYGNGKTFKDSVSFRYY